MRKTQIHVTQAQIHNDNAPYASGHLPNVPPHGLHYLRGPTTPPAAPPVPPHLHHGLEPLLLPRGQRLAVAEVAQDGVRVVEPDRQRRGAVGGCVVYVVGGQGRAAVQGVVSCAEAQTSNQSVVQAGLWVAGRSSKTPQVNRNLPAEEGQRSPATRSPQACISPGPAAPDHLRISGWGLTQERPDLSLVLHDAHGCVPRVVRPLKEGPPVPDVPFQHVQ